MRPSYLLLLLICLSLTACSSRYTAPVDQAGAPRFLDDGKTHRVNGGETLYAIAWMYDLDVNALAQANNVFSPYTIFPGQILTVDPRALPNLGQSRTGSVATVGTATVTAVQATSGLQRTPLEAGGGNGTVRQPLPAPTTSPTPSPRQAAPVTPTARPPEPNPSPAVVATAERAPAPVTSSPPLTTGKFSGDTGVTWDWPYRGSIVGRFADTAVEGKGLDLAGAAGDSILAAADGEVVYAGSGLLRYGNLLILKHNDHFLSAYAHNQSLLVREGEEVRRGQKIAELGSSGVDRNMLHFEIRRDGQPVDPQQFLPE